MNQSPTFFSEKTWAEKLRGLFWIVLILAIIAGGIWYFRVPEPLIQDPDSFQAVFLDNNQVYFGKLKAAGRGFFRLTDIYYLRAGSVGQPGLLGENPEIDLVKLGAEIHGPRDEMIINKDHIIFYEELSSSGVIMEKIRKHKAGK